MLCRSCWNSIWRAVPPIASRRRAGWTDLGDGVLRFDIEANAFCHQMIRSVVGTLVDVGLARKHAGELLGILAGRDRSKASALAPPHGLCLWEVAYPDTGPG